MPAFRRGAVLTGAALVLSAATLHAQKAPQAGEGGRPVVSTTVPGPVRAIYVATLDVLERQGYETRIRLLDQVIMTIPRQDTPIMDEMYPQVVVEMEARGDSTSYTVSARVMNKRGEPLDENVRGTAAVLLAEMSVTAAVDSALDLAAGRLRGADVREESDEFGYGRENAVRVGGAAEAGLANQRAYLGRLRGPGGQTVRYRRLGSCCNFKTSHAPQGTGALDAYEITYDGQESPQVIYIDFYTPPPAVQRAPEGFTLQADASGAPSR